jgi:CheY-like chemotaxis protein
MGGEIGLTSSFGTGSTFWFTARFEKQEPTKTVREPNGDLSGARILIVDDNAANRNILKHQTSSWGMIVSEAESAVQALELLRSGVAEGKPYDIAALDLVMPDMDGFQLAESIKSDPTISSVLLILLPSSGKRGHGERASHAGIAAYLPKPVQESQLHDCLTAVMRRSVSGRLVAPAHLVTRHSLCESEIQDTNSTFSNIRILIAEDNIVNQEVALGQLSSLGYGAEAVQNGQELLKALETATVDIILMDCQMPEMDGFAATAEIRRREGTSRHTIIIAMTANALPSDREKCLAAGMDAFITKPVKSKTLGEIFQKFLGNGNFSPTPNVSSIPTLAPTTYDSSIVDVACLADAASSPEKLRHIIGLYLRHTKDRLEELKEAVKEKSASDVYAIAHKCLGSSRSCGMSAIVPALSELQRMGKADDLNGAAEQYNAAEAAFQKLAPFLELYVEQLPV